MSAASEISFRAADGPIGSARPMQRTLRVAAHLGRGLVGDQAVDHDHAVFDGGICSRMLDRQARMAAGLPHVGTPMVRSGGIGQG